MADTPDPIPDPLNAVAAGKMPAVSLPPIVGQQTTPQADFVISNFNNLGKYNLAYHEFSSGKDQGLSVVYNPKLVNPKELDKAHADGKLFEKAPLVPPPTVLPQQAGGPSGAPQPSQPQAPSQPSAPTPEQAPTPPDAPQLPNQPPLANVKVPVDRRAQSARLQNIKVPGPNQPNPVGNQLSKRAI